MISTLKSWFTANKPEMANDHSNRLGYFKILSLTDEELIETLCLEPIYKEFDPNCSNTFLDCQSDRFLAALFDPGTSFDFKSNEIFHIVEPQYVEYKQFAVKLKLRDHPTNTLNENDIKDIREYLDAYGSKHGFIVLMRPDLNILQVLNYLNETNTLKSDREIDDYTSRINSERLPKFLIAIQATQYLRIFCKLMNFYSNSLETRTNYTSPQELVAKVIQRQKSNIEGTIPHRNCVYFFTSNIEYKSFFSSTKIRHVINDDFLKSYSDIKIDFDNPHFYDDTYFTIYDMECGNEEINVRNNQRLESAPPEYSEY
ncbi:hypothetical protein BN7_5047 [Wickerhamomyces ciferrii]|uniref:Uncharacterized protein n=1 Tax=Wickerhamomyces ciferrii (strain ATCC 14091 / BCRC 22168 / CBS 111 / JCM 3599 / NBRC 0793 / NRRL Y-1031 F-60-10) TaxID=1206466 RepID=K0KJM3_WICCF|nr:uncharacterized protein BN7_5047 [Wickerhamomyces ciferrii]CCH45465.1 hypothetical protein BN7_5047 [Wickerhamomyces ciferrii]